MAFLDNSGDIILDAVLTSEGRRRLARGDGSFSIKKFALGDDEIDYSLYEKNHASGSAYYDLKILQTPVLEAITNSNSGLKSHLVSIIDERKFYMPTLILNTLEETSATSTTTGSFHIPVSLASRDLFSQTKGSLDGYSPKDGKAYIKIYQCLNTDYAVSPDAQLDADDRETQYIIYMDNRLGSLTDMDGVAIAKSFVDEDDVATYYVTLSANSKMVTDNNNTEKSAGTEVISGPRGTRLRFKIRASLNLQRSEYLFNQIGGTTELADKDGTIVSDVKFIDTTIKVVGATTGNTIEVPVRFVKSDC